MSRTQPDWEIAAIFSKINLYYFTGTMQEGMLLIPRDDAAILWVRPATTEPWRNPFSTYKAYGKLPRCGRFNKMPETCYIEAEIIPVAFLQRFQRYFPFKNIKSADKQINKPDLLRASMKSP